MELTLRMFSVLLLGALIGVITARFPWFADKTIEFSDTGFLIGVGMVLSAYVISAPIRKTVNKDKTIDEWRRKVINTLMVFLLLSLVSFAVFIYTFWEWARALLAISILCNVLVSFGAVIYGAFRGNDA